jgi:hypothetical protein
MSFSNKLPNIFIQAALSNIVGVSTWPYNDGSYWYNNGAFYTWQADLVILAQDHSSQYTTTPYSYDGLDLRPGLWLAGGVPTRAVQIRSIVSQTRYAATLILEDVERFNTFYDIDGYGQGIMGEGDCYIFALGDDGLPIILPVSTSAFVDGNFSIDLISRFRINNPNFRYRLNKVAHGFIVGDEICIDPGTGQYQLTYYGRQPIGRVCDVSDSPDTFLITPANHIIEGIAPPLPGVPGDIIYHDDSSPGHLTLSQSSQTAYIKLNNTTGMQLTGSVSGGGGTAPAVGIYPNLASRPITSTAGSMAYIIDNGNGEWAMYIWVSDMWVETTNKDSSQADAYSAELIITNTTTSPALISTLSTGRRVTLITISVTTIFDGTPIINIGDDTVNDRLMPDGLINLGVLGTYATTSDHLYNTGIDTDINTYLIPGGATQGEAIITLTYV